MINNNRKNLNLHVITSKLLVAENGLDKAVCMMIEAEVALRDAGHKAQANKLERFITTLTSVRSQMNHLV